MANYNKAFAEQVESINNAYAARRVAHMQPSKRSASFLMCFSPSPKWGLVENPLCLRTFKRMYCFFVFL